MATATTSMLKRSELAAVLAITLTVVGVFSVIMLIACNRLNPGWSHSMERLGFDPVPQLDALYWLAMSSCVILLATCACGCCLYQTANSKAQVNMKAWAAMALVLHVAIIGISCGRIPAFGLQGLSKSSVDSLVDQHQAVEIFNKGYCSTWCLSNDSPAGIEAQFPAGTCDGGDLQRVYKEFPPMEVAADKGIGKWCFDALQHSTFTSTPGSKHGTSPFDALMDRSWTGLVSGGWNLGLFLCQVFAFFISVCLMPWMCVYLDLVFQDHFSPSSTRQRDTTIDDDDDVVDVAYAKETEKQVVRT